MKRPKGQKVSGKMKVYAVNNTVCYMGECPRDTIFSSVELFTDLDSAKEWVVRMIREDWETQVELPNGEIAPLWEHPGYTSDPDGNIKYGDTFFSEDGLAAWECRDSEMRRLEVSTSDILV